MGYRSSLERLGVTHLPFPTHNETLDRQRLGAHRPIRVQAGRRDTDFRTKAELTAVAEAR